MMLTYVHEISLFRLPDEYSLIADLHFESNYYYCYENPHFMRKSNSKNVCPRRLLLLLLLGKSTLYV